MVEDYRLDGQSIPMFFLVFQPVLFQLDKISEFLPQQERVVLFLVANRRMRFDSHIMAWEYSRVIRQDHQLSVQGFELRFRLIAEVGSPNLANEKCISGEQTFFNSY